MLLPICIRVCVQTCCLLTKREQLWTLWEAEEKRSKEVAASPSTNYLMKWNLSGIVVTRTMACEEYVKVKMIVPSFICTKGNNYGWQRVKTVDEYDNELLALVQSMEFAFSLISMQCITCLLSQPQESTLEYKLPCYNFYLERLKKNPTNQMLLARCLQKVQQQLHLSREQLGHMIRRKQEVGYYIIWCPTVL